VNPRRRSVLLALAGGGMPPTSDAETFSPRRELQFPLDHGAHLQTRTEWWYATGWLDVTQSAPLGFQVTFFRSRTGLASDLPGRFAARQLLFAHAAVSDIAAGRHRYAQRIVRWSGDENIRDAYARRADTDVAIGHWRLARSDHGAGSRYRCAAVGDAGAFAIDLTLDTTQPLLLQGESGLSRKGPLPTQASYYYSQPQLVAQARVMLDGRTRELQGRAWLDHEWSDEVLAVDAVGWDWIGINLSDGGALTAFQLRRRDGSVVWAGGSHRAPGAQARVFAANEIRFTPGPVWISPSSGARYPVRWQVRSPVGEFEVRALMQAQELDGRQSTGTAYWEGLADWVDASDKSVGRGYLEMTGYAQALRI